MNIELTKLFDSLSVALDYVEAEIVNIEPYHGKRVAYLTDRMAIAAGMDYETRYALTQAAGFHDCALSEYMHDELGKKFNEQYMEAHCRAGEEKLAKLPFYRNVEKSVLYHHECADGTGAFRMTAENTPMTAQLIHLADNVDIKFPLYHYESGMVEDIVEWVKSEEGKLFSSEAIDIFCKSITDQVLQEIKGENAKTIFEGLIPDRTKEVSTEVFKDMASIFADITDYKSHFTWNHSQGIAEKAEAMGQFYGYDKETCDKLFVAGALHDVGKLLISNDILEKPGKLTSDEYKEIQNHALGTWDMLKGIRGIEDITRWAARHHEKLDGSGYPFGMTGEQLDSNDRLLACLDIYQALVEERPYKAGLSHEEAIGILRKMGNEGQLDNGVISDIDECFGVGIEAIEVTGRPAIEITVEGEAWICPVCGYVYEGELPEDFICPRCEQPGTIFERVSN